MWHKRSEKPLTIISYEKISKEYLSNYQKRAVRFLMKNSGAGLFDEMGVGKTASAVVALGKVHEFDPTRDDLSLIVTINVVKPWWKIEVERLTGLPVTILDRKHRQPQMGVNIIHYELIPHLCGLGKSTYDKNHDLRKYKWSVVILDESRKIKNRKSKIGKLIHAIRGKYCWCLDGSAVPNHPQELWNQLKWMYPKKYKSFWKFIEEYCDMTKGVWTDYVIGDLKSKTKLYNDLKPIVLRRTKEQVLDLPPKERVVIPVTLSRKERKAYESLINDKITKWKELIWAWNDASAQALSRHLMSGGRGHTTKTKVARELIDELVEQGHQVVVFSAFSKPLDTLLTHKGEVRLVSGETKENESRIQKFQRGDLKVLGTTITLGGAGITLSNADRAIFLDLSYVPADNVQAEDRLHRRGQKQGVIIYYLVCPDTIDMGILDAVNCKHRTISKVWGEKLVKTWLNF